MIWGTQGKVVWGWLSSFLKWKQERKQLSSSFPVRHYFYMWCLKLWLPSCYMRLTVNTLEVTGQKEGKLLLLTDVTETEPKLDLLHPRLPGLAKPCSKCFAGINPFYICSNPRVEMPLFSHLKLRKLKHKMLEVNCPQLPTHLTIEQGFKNQHSVSRACPINHHTKTM